MSAQKQAAAPPTEKTELTDGQELYRLQQDSHDDGTVTVRAHDWDRITDDTVRVWFVTPTGDLESEKMDWPQHSDTSKFGAVLDAAGYSFADAESFGEHGRELRADPEDWTLDVRNRSFVGRMLRRWNTVGDESTLVYIAKSPVYYIIAHFLLFPVFDPDVSADKGHFYENASGEDAYMRDRLVLFGILLNDLLWAVSFIFLLAP